MKITIITAILAAFINLSAFPEAPVQNIAPRPEVPMVEKSEKVGVSKIIMKIPIGTIWARVKTPYETQDIPWKSSSFEEEGQFKSIAAKLLRNYGYDVLEDSDDLFGTGSAAKARFQIAGIISKTFVDQNIYYQSACTPGAGSIAVNSKVEMVAEWQIYDSIKDKVILKIETTGYYKNEKEKDLQVIIFDTFEDTFLRLMANAEFVKALTGKSIDTTEKPTDTSPIKAGYSLDGQKTKMPSGISDLFKSVVTIKVGVTHGTGMIISADGYILTAAHVVDGADKVAVVFESGEQAEGTVIRLIRTNDSAIIKVNKKNLPFIPIAKAQPPIGSEVFVIGTPLDKSLSYSVTKGIISGYREKNDIKYIQTDTPVNPGNSGGPLIDGNGYIIGIISSKLMGPGVESIGFAIPVHEALRTLNIQKIE
ncbi:MAG: serine protease [Spirochaetales bacterium]|nr:serine protease [Spirochaetales bacterium]